MNDEDAEDVVVDVTEALGTAHSELRGWQDLLDNPRFAKLVQVLQEQADSMQMSVVHRPLKAMDEVLEQEWHKGRLSGLLALTYTVEAQMQNLQMEIDLLEEKKNGSKSRAAP